MIHHPELTTLVDTLRFHAARSPDAVAVRMPGGVRVSYAELAATSRRIEASLSAARIGHGDRVAYLGHESVAYWGLLFACARTGAVLVPINRRLTAGEVAHILADSGARAIAIDGDHPLRRQTGILELEVESLATSTAAELADSGAWEPTPDTPIAQLYTSGTTGLPKGVVLAHRSFFAIRDALASERLDWIDWRHGDVALIGIPGFHVGGLWYATQAFHAGATVYSLPSFDPAAAVAAIRDDHVTVAILVPAMMASMIAESARPADYAVLRKVVYGGAPIAESVLDEASRVFGCDFAQIYGLTETGNTAICLPPEQHVAGSPRLRAAGRPYPGVDVKIVGVEGVELPPGAVGEVHLRTPAHMVEYWGLAEATSRTLVDGWIVTGDAGYLDDEGYLFIHDRVKDMVLVAGENVYPAEIENALLHHPAVVDAAVVGVPDAQTGEAVVAYVVLTAPGAASTRDLALFLRGHLADFKRPTRYEFVPQIPRNPSGKILRRELRDPHWHGRERRVN